MSAKKIFVKATEVLLIRFSIRMLLRFSLFIAHSYDVVREVLRASKNMPYHHAALIVSKFDLAPEVAYSKHSVRLRVRTAMDALRLNAVEKEPWTAEWIEEKLENGGVFYDIGANVGAYSLIASKVGVSNAKVYSFEPSAANYATLCENILLNKCQYNTFPLQIALSDKTEAASFVYEEMTSGSALHKIAKTNTQKKSSSSFIQNIIKYSLDDVIKNFDLPFPNYIKIDVDGHEIEVLKGADSALKNSELKSIIAEVDKDADGKEFPVKEILEGYGFSEVNRFKRKDPESEATPPEYVIFEKRS